MLIQQQGDTKKLKFAFKWKYFIREQILLIKQNENEYIYYRQIHIWKKFASCHESKRFRLKLKGFCTSKLKEA